MALRSFSLIALVLLSPCRSSFGAENFADLEPYWTLLHEPAVVEELELTAAQREQYVGLLDDLDVRFFPLRNKSREVAEAGSAKLISEARDKLKPILKPRQQQRLRELTLRRLGIQSVLHPDVAERLKYSATQRQQLEKTWEETRTAAAEIEKKVQAGEPRQALDKDYHDLQLAGQKKLLKLLKPEQQAMWQEMLGESFDTAKLGRAKYKVPELVDTDGWINSRGETLAKHRGKVVVVHFYACGCINCIHNYPWYREWQQKFADEDFVLIGIHSPETSAERDLSHVRKKAAEEKLTFPILLDGQSQNWDNWGNSMWPSVYVIDQEGYLRYFWPGELKWQGNDGEKLMRERITELLQEETSNSPKR